MALAYDAQRGAKGQDAAGGRSRLSERLERVELASVKPQVLNKLGLSGNQLRPNANV